MGVGHQKRPEMATFSPHCLFVRLPDLTAMSDETTPSHGSLKPPLGVNTFVIFGESPAWGWGTSVGQPACHADGCGGLLYAMRVGRSCMCAMYVCYVLSNFGCPSPL